ncbi:SDR family oxidoreductase [Rhodococcus olei]|uniref:SDR family oxidoreductase n=1 Tax=Rhodococcus olei TaxID=2161675 RepID=A0ABP8PQ75_9NOCA
MSARFDGKLALVTGAGSGLGEAIAIKFVAEGARVIAVDLTSPDSLVDRFGESVIPWQADVSDADNVRELEEWVRNTYGGLDVLANNAGIGGIQRILHEYPIDEFDRVVEVNVRGSFLMLQAAVRLMLGSGGGAVVNTASIASFRGTPHSSAYATSKGALVMLTRAAALDYARHGIRVNAVAPGVTRTPILDTRSTETIAKLADLIPQGRVGEPADVANVVAFLADDNETAHVTGQVWVVDGGRSAG